MDDDRVGSRIGAAQAGDLAGAWLSRNNIVGSNYERSVGRQQRGAELWQRQPLEVDDVGAARCAAVAQHLWKLGCEPRSGAQFRTRLPTQHPAEALIYSITLCSSDIAVAERAATERYVGARACQRRAKRTVVRRRVSRRVDDMNTHWGAQYELWPKSI